MKLKSLIRRAYDIIKDEHDHVMDEFREDDGSFTPENFSRAAVLKRKYVIWMTDAEHVRHQIVPKPRRRRPTTKQRKIVVVK